MKLAHLPIDAITVPHLNPNEMDESMRSHLRRSIERYGLVEAIVVRQNGATGWVVTGGVHRLLIARELGYETVPCVVVNTSGADTLLLAQALNHISGQDNLGLRAEVVRRLLDELPEDQILAVLPESAESLDVLASLGQDDIAGQIANWERAQSAKLKHLTFQLVPDQVSVVEEALGRAVTDVDPDSENPNKRGNALFALCSSYLKLMEAKSS
jgi:ParB-like chromosome segregation protein Spo0J